MQNQVFDKIAGQFSTPTYVYSAKKIKSQFETLSTALNNIKPDIHYAVKANSNLSVLSFLNQLGSGFDTVSQGEIFRLLHIGVDPKKVVFSGVGKTASEIEYAINAKLKLINVESLSELKLLNDVATRLQKSVDIGLRINPNVPVAVHPHLATGMKSSKFGIDENVLDEVWQIISANPLINLKGITCHIGTGVNQIDALMSAYSSVLNCADKYRELGAPVEFVDFGGGFAVSFSGHYEPLDFKLYSVALEKLLKNKPYKVLFEPGKFLVAESGILLARVVHTKCNSEKNFIIVDAGMNDLIRPSLYDAYHAIELIPQDNIPRAEIVADIVGPVCESGCFFAKERKILEAKPGDLVVIYDAGAYGFTMSSRYNTRSLPAEVMLDMNEVPHLIKRRENYEEIISGEIILNKFS